MNHVPADSGIPTDSISSNAALAGDSRARNVHASVSDSLNEISLITHRIGENATRLRTHLHDFANSDTLRQMRALLDSIK